MATVALGSQPRQLHKAATITLLPLLPNRILSLPLFWELSVS